MAEKARDEAIDMLNSTQKELELVRKNDTQLTFQVPRANELSSMPLQQLYQLQQQIQQDLQSVEEVHLDNFIIHLYNTIYFYRPFSEHPFSKISFVNGGSYQVK